MSFSDSHTIVKDDVVLSTILSFKNAIDDFDDSEDNELHLIVSDSLPTMSGSGLIKERTLAGLLARLKTFSNLSWSVKPIEVSPLVCAQYGWIGKQPDLLTCVTCKNYLCIKLPASPALNNHFISETVEKLSSNHDNLCPWKLFPAVESLPVLKFNNPAADLSVLASIADGLCGAVTQIDEQLELDIACPQLAQEFLAIIDATAPAATADFVTDSQMRLKRRLSYQLAVTGWTLPAASTEGKDGKGILCCRFCQRRLGLWNLSRLAQRQERRRLAATDGESNSDGDLGASLLDASKNSCVEECDNAANQSYSAAKNRPDQSETPANGSPDQLESLVRNQSEPNDRQIHSRSDCATGSANHPESSVENQSEPTDRQIPSQLDCATDSTISQSADLPAEPPTKRARQSPSDEAAVFTAKLEPHNLHWLWCPWRNSQVTEAWCRSVLLGSPVRRVVLRRAQQSPSSLTSPTLSSSVRPTIATEGCAKVTQLLRSFVY